MSLKLSCERGTGDSRKFQKICNGGNDSAITGLNIVISDSLQSKLPV